MSSPLSNSINIKQVQQIIRHRSSITEFTDQEQQIIEIARNAGLIQQQNHTYVLSKTGEHYLWLQKTADNINENKKTLPAEFDQKTLEELASYLTYVDCKNLNLSNQDLQNFITKLRNVETLVINNTNITSLSLLHCKKLQTLNYSGCENLTTLDLPENLKRLNCSNCNNLTTLDLPENLQLLFCSNCNNLTTLDLPENLKKLNCSNCNNLTTINLPANLQLLNCSGCNNLTTLNLPEGSNLQTLNCSNCNNLATINLPANLQLLNCSDCNNLTTLNLPEGSNLQTLDCRNCRNLTTLNLPEGSNLQKLNCSNCNNLATLNLPENLQELYCSSCNHLITFNLPEGSNLQKLDCNFCRNLTTLNLPKNLQELDCSICDRLITLDLPESLQKLDCNGCDHLITLDLPKNLQMLYCNSCNNLTTLNLPENLQELYCSYCNNLTTLNLSENLQKLACSNCNNLTTLNLPEESNLQILICNNCTSLTTLDLSENLQILICNNCDNLTTITNEALLNCRIIDICNTEIAQLPQLPATTTVYSGNSRYEEFSSFIVDLKTLEEDPLSILLQLGQDFLLQGKPFPNIVFKDSRLEEGQSPGIDAGGLRRHLVSTLFQNLFNLKDPALFIGETGEKLPILDPNSDQDLKKAIKTIGRLFTLCQTSTLLTGAYFNENFFKAILWYMDNTNLSKDHLNERIFAIVKGWNYDELDHNIQNSIPDHIAESNCVYPIKLIADEMKTIGDFPQNITALEIQRQIQGSAIKTAHDLSNNINWRANNSSPEQVATMKRFLGNWAQKMEREKPQKLEDFVLFATGSRSIGDDKLKIELFPSRDKQQLPAAHACFNTVEMPIYDSQDIFNQKTELALSAITGFQFA